jgi:pimeloyl-ACP methyl ester carboxylesterase
MMKILFMPGVGGDPAFWRPVAEYRRHNPRAPSWIYELPPGHEADLRSLRIPTLLIWATRDPISPPAVGRHVAALLPSASLIELDDDSHLFARERPDAVAALIRAHLAQP